MPLLVQPLPQPLLLLLHLLIELLPLLLRQELRFQKINQQPFLRQRHLHGFLLPCFAVLRIPAGHFDVLPNFGGDALLPVFPHLLHFHSETLFTSTDVVDRLTLGTATA